MSQQNTRPQHTTLFVKTGCARCARVREYLAAQHIDFIERNVTMDKSAGEDLKKFSDQDKTPTLIYEGDVLADFDVEQLTSFLEKHGVSAEQRH